MSDKDAVSKKYLQDNARFADLFNFYLYGGRQVIQPDQLKQLDTTAITLPYGQDGKSSPVQTGLKLSHIIPQLGKDKIGRSDGSQRIRSLLYYPCLPQGRRRINGAEA